MMREGESECKTTYQDSWESVYDGRRNVSWN
jgi:hypothetical protein